MSLDSFAFAYSKGYRQHLINRRLYDLAKEKRSSKKLRIKIRIDGIYRESLAYRTGREELKNGYLLVMKPLNGCTRTLNGFQRYRKIEMKYGKLLQIRKALAVPKRVCKFLEICLRKGNRKALSLGFAQFQEG